MGQSGFGGGGHKFSVPKFLSLMRKKYPTFYIFFPNLEIAKYLRDTVTPAPSPSYTYVGNKIRRVTYSNITLTLFDMHPGV